MCMLCRRLALVSNQSWSFLTLNLTVVFLLPLIFHQVRHICQHWHDIDQRAYSFYPSALPTEMVLSYRSFQTLRNSYLWNRCTDVLRSKFYGNCVNFKLCITMVTWPFTLHGLDHWSKYVKSSNSGFQTLRNICLWNRWTDLSRSKFYGIVSGRIFTAWSSVEFSRPVVVQRYGHVPIRPIWACPMDRNA